MTVTKAINVSSAYIQA